jgi:hypothetical protein
MATINLGNIKFNWKGAYAGGTAYVIDDVVSYSGSSYICKLASTGNLPTNATYWEQMSAAGTDGTDVGTTITTQGDILFRDGSGLQRLAKGSAADVLTMNAGATAPEWTAPSSEAGKFPFYAYVTSATTITASTDTEVVFGTERFDENSKYDASTGRYAPGETGIYFVSATLSMNAMTSDLDDLYTKFQINGTGDFIAITRGSALGNDGYVRATALIKLTGASDYISVWCYQDGGGGRTVYDGDKSFFTGYKVA